MTLVGLSGLTYAQQGARKNKADRMETMREMHQQGNRMLGIPGLTEQQKEKFDRITERVMLRLNRGGSRSN